ncbi:MAG TPA: hypothetical protein VJI71_02645 [Candidatus Norongarragalinales archaeon]|nr:hypothetical protein [Candidatus Norongarragalinales archaeon]
MRKRRPSDFPGFGGFGLNDEFFEEFEKIEEEMRKMLESHLKEFESDEFKSIDDLKPRIYGFTLSFGPEGKKEIMEFGTGSQPSKMQKALQEKKAGWQPFVEVLNKPGEVSIVAELPGVESKHLDLKAFPNQLNLRVSDPLRLLSKTIALPSEVDHASLKYTLKNGILEVVLKKKK